MRQSDIDDIERWVAEGNLGQIEFKLGTQGALTDAGYRSALFQARDRDGREVAMAANQFAERLSLIAIAANLPL